MITEQQAAAIAKKYLESKEVQYVRLNTDNIKFTESQVIIYGKYENQERSIFSISYEIEGYQYNIVHFITIDAETGEVLFTITPHGYAEEWE